MLNNKGQNTYLIISVYLGKMLIMSNSTPIHNKNFSETGIENIHTLIFMKGLKLTTHLMVKYTIAFLLKSNDVLHHQQLICNTELEALASWNKGHTDQRKRKVSFIHRHDHIHTKILRNIILQKTKFWEKC